MLGDEQRCLEAGCSGYLTKPIDIPQLISTIRDALLLDEEASATLRRSTTINEPTEHDSPILSTLPTELLPLQLIIERFKVTELGHGLAGSGGTVGFDCLTESARRLQQAAKSHDQAAVEIELQEIKALTSRLVNPRATVEA